MDQRPIDRLLSELEARYELTQPFLARLRPMVETILSDAIPADRKIPLLEEVAATCQREQKNRRNISDIRHGLGRLIPGFDGNEKADDSPSSDE